jgi:putative effector of murein hydrolase
MILGLLTSGLGGLFMMGVFFPRIRGGAALTGFLTGVLMVLAISLYTNIHFLLYGAIGIVVSVMVGWLVSVLFNKQKS